MSVEATHLRRRGRDYREMLFKSALLLSLVIGFATLIALLVDVFVTGWSHVTWQFLTSPPSTDPTIAGARPAILATIFLGIMLNGLTIKNFPYYTQDFVKGVVLMVALLLTFGVRRLR